MNTIEINKYVFKSPDDWNSLTRKQLLYIAGRLDYWLWLSKKQYSIGKEKFFLLMKLMSISRFNILSRKTKLFYKLFHSSDEDSLAGLLITTDFVFSGENTLTKNLLPTIRKGFKTYYGPSDRLSNIGFYEFVFADSFYLKYRETKNKKWLNLLVASLYRPKLERFDNALLEKRAELFSRISLAEKQAIYIFYIGCRISLVKKYPDAFSSNKANKGKNYGWEGIILGLAGNRFGTIEETRQTNLHTVLTYIQMNSEKNENI